MWFETCQFLKYGDLACIPTFHTTAPFLFTSPKVKFKAFKGLKNGAENHDCDFTFCIHLRKPQLYETKHQANEHSSCHI